MVPRRARNTIFFTTNNTNIFFGKPKNFCMTSPFVQIRVIRGCIFCSQQTARTMLSRVIRIVVKIPHVMFLPILTTLRFLRTLRRGGANNITAIGGRDKEPAGHSPRHRGSLSARAIRNGERCSGRLSAISRRKRHEVSSQGSERRKRQQKQQLTTKDNK